jgi:Leucine-rich repeat (LRR) protein
LLTVLPNEIGFLSALQILHIFFCNDLERLPSTIGELEQLKKLTLRYNPFLQSIPKEIGMLNNLRRLQIASCNLLTILPDKIGQLSQLQSLTLTDCRGLERLLSTMGELQHLAKLQIDKCCCLRSLPPLILDLTELQSLELTDMPEKQIVQFFVPGCNNLHKLLESVDLDGCNLGKGNSMSKVWSFLLHCPKLESVRLQDNSIASLCATANHQVSIDYCSLSCAVRFQHPTTFQNRH